MRPWFNTAGPCLPAEHYMLPPERRLGRVLQLISDQKFFTLHAGRQTGKTTSAFWLVRHLNAEGRFCAVWIDLQTAREQPDVARAMRTILGNVDRSFASTLPAIERPTRAEVELLLQDPENALLSYLSTMAARSPKPLVLLLDEADGLVGATMVSFLTQLRTGYVARDSNPFPVSIVLIGMRQVRDFALAAEDRSAVSWLGTTSPFNITAEATTLDSFTRDEVTELLSQHEAATGQRFEPEAIKRIWHLGQGHPWITNALADLVTDRLVPDRVIAITAANVDAAKETLIIERRSHIDSMVARLREPRVRRILAPMIAGERTDGDVLDDDFAYVTGLGLITQRQHRYEIANPVYREVIPRALTHVMQSQLNEETAWYVRPDGSLDIDRLLGAFQQFWRKDGHLAAEGFHYREAGPHLVLMAFLQRIVNGGGRIEREYGLGRGALDLMILWQQERHAIEVKLRRDTETEEDALEQVARYLDEAGLESGRLVLFDLRQGPSWAEKLTRRELEWEGKRVVVIGC